MNDRLGRPLYSDGLPVVPHPNPRGTAFTQVSVVPQDKSRLRRPAGLHRRRDLVRSLTVTVRATATVITIGQSRSVPARQASMRVVAQSNSPFVNVTGLPVRARLSCGLRSLPGGVGYPTGLLLSRPGTAASESAGEPAAGPRVPDACPSPSTLPRPSSRTRPTSERGSMFSPDDGRAEDHAAGVPERKTRPRTRSAPGRPPRAECCPLRCRAQPGTAGTCSR